MNSLNASTASAITHWNIQKNLLLNKIEKKRSESKSEVSNNTSIAMGNKTNFYKHLNTNMDQSVEKLRTFINSIIHY
jgi:hypothetical protein